MTAGRTPGGIALVLLGAIACAPPGRPPAPRASPIDTLPMRAHAFFLAHDLLLGRGTGTPGAEVAALYIEAQCRARGLRPVGATYAHPVPLDHVVPRPTETSLRVGDRQFTVARDFLITGGTPAGLTGFAGAAVAVGSADTIRRHPDALPALDGAVAVVSGVVRADVAGLLARRGAIGIVQVVDDPETYALYAASRGTTLTVLREAVPSSFFGELPSVIAGPAVAAALGQRGVRIELAAAFDRSPIPAANVACLLPGVDAGRRDTAIVFTAHYDHLGVSLPDAAGDSIYNGFSDNAAGVAMLFMIADAMRRRPEGGPSGAVPVLHRESAACWITSPPARRTRRAMRALINPTPARRPHRRPAPAAARATCRRFARRRPRRLERHRLASHRQPDYSLRACPRQFIVPAPRRIRDCRPTRPKRCVAGGTTITSRPTATTTHSRSADCNGTRSTRSASRRRWMDRPARRDRPSRPV
jgi:hypothetical protein